MTDAPSRPTSGIHLIAAVCKKFGIGYAGKLPWNISQDLKKFRDLTNNGIIVMGRKTYDSLPTRPLPNRLHIVMTRTLDSVTNHDVIQVDKRDDLVRLITSLSTNRAVWVIGGADIFTLFLSNPYLQPNMLWLTQIDRSFECDRFFPMPSDYTLKSFSGYYCEQEKCAVRDLVYIRDDMHLAVESEEVYLNLLSDIEERGIERVDRTGVGTRAVFGRSMRFDLTAAFPILTTKFVSWRIIIEELLWFLRGETDSKRLEARDINIWRQNTTKSFQKQRGLEMLQEGDIGGMYGYVWRHGGQKYTGPQSRESAEGKDQLAYVLETLKTDPYSRRIIMTSNDVTNLDTGVLYPCHGLLVQFFVQERKAVKYLSCSMTQRSADCFLGLPINIASYAALTHILAAKTDMIAKELVININDAHIYHTHKHFVAAQLKRTPLPAPQIVLSDAVKTKAFEELTLDDFDLPGYFYHPAMKAPMAV